MCGYLIFFLKRAEVLTPSKSELGELFIFCVQRTVGFIGDWTKGEYQDNMGCSYWSIGSSMNKSFMWIKMGYKISFFYFWICSLAVPASQGLLINPVFMKTLESEAVEKKDLDLPHLIWDIYMTSLGMECDTKGSFSNPWDRPAHLFLSWAELPSDRSFSRQVTYQACYLGPKAKTLKWLQRTRAWASGQSRQTEEHVPRGPMAEYFHCGCPGCQQG